MRALRLLPVLFFSAPAFGAELPPELKTFLGPKPPKFGAQYSAPAKALRRALLHAASGKHGSAANELRAQVSAGAAFREHALYQLGLALHEEKDYAASTAQLERLRLDYPSTPYADAADDLLLGNACERGLKEAKAKQAGAAAQLQRCLERTPWRSWGEREAEASALYELYRRRQDPLLGSFVAELIQGMPASTQLRTKIAKDIPPGKLSEYASVPRYRTRSGNPAGVKASYPDQELFDQGMDEVLKGKWRAARSTFRQFEENYAQSEHRDRAAYWLARAEEELGNDDDASTRYEAIFKENPLTYYGLQAALRTKKDLTTYLRPNVAKPEGLRGTPYPRQQLSLWRLRALLEEGLLEPARMEARGLFFYKPGGSTFGQDTALGAALTAFLYHVAGYSNASFSHAYAALSLDGDTLNSFLLDILFPRLFTGEFDRASVASQVNPLLLLSVTKQESAFLPNAVSKANAFGLMQLLLGTARETDPKLRREDLFEPGPNTLAGARYLGKLLKRFDGNIALALAGYNAGPTRAAQWQKRMADAGLKGEKFDVDAFIDTIPFTETRRYVGSILRNYAWYKLVTKDGKVGSIQELAYAWQKTSNDPPVLPEPEKLPESPVPPAPVMDQTAPKPPPPGAPAEPPPPLPNPAPENSAPAPVEGA